jgi:uncharacterized protein (DUF58 family)
MDRLTNAKSGSRQVPWGGIISIASAAALLTSLPRLLEISGRWEGTLRWGLIGLAAYLLLFGTRQTMLAMGSSGVRSARWNRHRMSVTREGIVYVIIMSVLFIGSILGKTNMLMFVFAMMIGPWVLNGWIAFSMLRKTRAKRTLPRRGTVGELISVEIEVENNKWFLDSWLLTARDQATHDRDNIQPAALFVRIPARQKRRGHYFVRFAQRGRYRFGAIELSTQFPLGLIERGLLCDAGDSLIVHPRVGRLTSRWRREMRNASELVEQRRSCAGLFEDEFHRIREYRTDDNPKSIHWRTTARRGELMVREYHQTRDHELILLVELWQPAHPTPSDVDRVELAISLAATLLLENGKRSFDARLRMILVAGETMDWEHHTPVEVALDALALAVATPQADVRPAFEELQSRLRSGSCVVVISSRKREDVFRPQVDSWRTSDVLVLSSEPRALAPYFVLEGTA